MIFLCVGSDRSTGDALGPLVGTELEKLGYNVIGTLDEPLHAVNLEERIKDIPAGTYTIAVDACLGQMSSVGQVRHKKGPLKPGAGVNKDLIPVGDENIIGIVNVGGFMEYFVLQNTRLSLVIKLVNEIVALIQERFPLNQVAATKEEEL